MAAVVLVQGASRGLGLEFCKHILSKKSEAVIIATCRNPEKALQLKDLGVRYPEKVTILKVDVTRENEIKQASEIVKSKFGKVDLLINSSAMLLPSGKGETSLRDVSCEGLVATLTTNTVGPLVMAKYFSPLLMKGSGAFGQQTADESKHHSGILVNMTAKVGSIGDNRKCFKSLWKNKTRLGGWYSYRMSKAALNMATRNLSIELGRGRPKVVCVSLHPGTVDTDLSRPYHKNVPKDKLFTTECSVQYLMNLIDNLSVDKTGKCFAWDGSEVPW
ncbi:C-factor isoform X1 [Acipenser oxyrinchus oxyrinchus]|uniref:C-factor isoform X1 n=1 Tax=Acipenser oxyrinchus oxyrinchus TaxID=40147 RepID=A0AAD8D6K5_ACIOX|nr:C-factor isoform X1 [Acipenser oxyrinchus oxyrinchus]